MDIIELKVLRNDYYIKKKEAILINDLNEYIKYHNLYNNISSKIHHLLNKDNEDYKQKKYESFKRCYKNNVEYYEKLKEKNRIRNKEKYVSKKES